MSTGGTFLEAVRRRAGVVISEEGRGGRMSGVATNALAGFF